MATDKPNSVVVTGAAGDLGTAVVDSFLADGYQVYGGDVAPIRARPGLIAAKLDVTERTQVFALARQAAAESTLKVWVNVAGLFEAARVSEADPDVWHKVIAINLSGTFHGCAAALSVMAPVQGGRIVNVGSLSGQLGGLSVHPAYGASKAGVHALTKAYALEGAKNNVFCNAVAPGPIDGRMTAKFSPGTLDKIRAGIPGKRLATMGEVVHAIRYLADDRAGHTTGAILQVNGGVLMTG